MKFLLNISFLFCLLSLLNVETQNISDAENKASGMVEYSASYYSYNDNSSFYTQKISALKFVTPRCYEYNFISERGEIKNNSIQKSLFHVIYSCKALRAIHLEKGFIYHAVHFLRHSSKYYIYALRHILI